jgi:hypothetical protein
MASQQKILNDIIELISDKVDGFGRNIPTRQQKLYDEIQTLLKDIEVKNGRIKQTVANLKRIGTISRKIEKAVLSDQWKKDVGEYLNGFKELSKLQRAYFEASVEKFKERPLLNEIKQHSIDAAKQSLLGAGIHNAVMPKIEEILRQNITSGGSYATMLNQLRDYITGTPETAGVLERWAKQITTDALNQYAAEYTATVAGDLGLEWFQYTGAIIETSRDLCKALVRKKYIHKVEFKDVIKGRFDEFKEVDGKINSKTGLPQGMVSGTDETNFHVYRGGYQCGHQLVPVSEVAVPRQVRVKVYDRYGIRYDAEGFRL